MWIMFKEHKKGNFNSNKIITTYYEDPYNEGMFKSYITFTP